MSKKMSSNTRNKIISTILVTSSVWLMAIAGAYYVSEYANINLPTLNKNSKAPVIIAKRVINEGELINEGDIEEKIIPINNIAKNTINVKKDLIGKITVNKLEPNEQIKKYDVTLKENQNNTLRPYSIPIKLENLSDLSINSNDFIDVMVVYPKNNNAKTKQVKSSDVVAAKLKVEYMADTSGNIVKHIGNGESEGQKTPSLLVVKASLEEIQSIEQARREGNLLFLKYSDKNARKTNVTYSK
ncbi:MULTISPECIES: hypothetical protein [Clostridium]|uniref:SAF domain-containing protein n=1 Tax=Clostridium sporogenes TaxID=1509 RepID=A0AAE6I9N4_CLOSG|nr:MULTISPECIES: hypothetical protein [Clostridium]APQ78765.1 SAF-like family protein [Clostridium botulinum]MBN3355942.1 hypothetical protein [Clostridium botulinum]QDY34448.1 hypothetical protein CGS26_19215 [Clostridium sporogenes]